jgi:cell division protein FtsA
LAAVAAEERDEGAVLIDLGAGATGVAAFSGDALVYCETIAVGGVRLTRDLAARLKTTFAAAERVKLHFSAVANACDPREAIAAPKLGADGRLEASTALRGAISETMTPRLYEMLLTVRDRLTRAGLTGDERPQRVVLVGGGASIPGVRELAVEALGMPVRLGRPFDLCGFEHSDVGPAYAAGAGMLRHRLDAPAFDIDDEGRYASLGQAASAVRNAVHDMWTWLRVNF